MAKSKKQGAKGQKIGRNRDRSPSHKKYEFSRRDQINKLRKLRKHVAAYPDDKRSASSLTSLNNGAAGALPVFPVTAYTPNKHRPDGVVDLELEYRKHEIKHIVKDGKKKRTIILHEPVASGPLYWVVSNGVTKDVTPSFEDAEAVFTKSHAACIVLERSGDHTTVLRNKRAMPPPGWENQIAKAYAG